MATSINGWTVITDPASSDLASEWIPRTTIKIKGHKHVLPLFLALAAEYGHTVAPLRKNECGMWNPRKARMANAWSDHASGTAIDLNWNHEGAMGKNGGMKSMSSQQVSACRALAKKYHLLWGGDYHNPTAWDPMHFAVKPGYGPMAMGLVTKSLFIQPDGTTRPSLNNIMDSSLVTTIAQKGLNKKFNCGLVVDGIVGPKTSAAILMAEKRLKLAPTGKISIDLLVKLGAI